MNIYRKHNILELVLVTSNSQGTYLRFHPLESMLLTTTTLKMRWGDDTPWKF